MQNKKEQREQMMVMIEDWQASGLKQREYCVANKVAYHVFHYWYGVYRAKKTDTGSFLPVKVSSAVSKEQITIIGVSGIKVQIPLTDKSIGFVKQLLLD
ncbi:MAG: hypothetical protein FD178_3164 [Ignavibacteria bacterium]|nr:MAG: hypothetical protein FD178_3164 [Ignavibacteria bacterium]